MAQTLEPIDAFSTNGLVEMLNITLDTLLAVKRSFSSGKGKHSKIFLTKFRGITNERKLNSVEGITASPSFPNAVQSFIPVSDNNFNLNGQFTQCFAFAVYL